MGIEKNISSVLLIIMILFSSLFFVPFTSAGVSSAVGITPNTVHAGDIISFDIDITLDTGVKFSIWRVNVTFVWSNDYSLKYTAVTSLPDGGYSSTLWNITPPTKVIYHIDNVPIPDEIQTHRYYDVNVTVKWCYGTDLDHLHSLQDTLSLFVEKKEGGASNNQTALEPTNGISTNILFLFIGILVGITITIIAIKIFKRKSKKEE